MSPEEEKVWQSIQRKESRVFEAYYKEHFRFFLLASNKYLQDPGRAQEIVNDVFLKLWEDAASITIQSTLTFYIHRAVVNRSLNALDKEKRERMRRQAFDHGPEETAETREMEYDELKIRLYRAIDQLPDQCRKVFTMSRFEEMKQQEIADRLGISIKTVKNHITHALKELNKMNKTLGPWVIFFVLYLNHGFPRYI
ncbi:RNA polymerase sigma-70 factor [Dinghuibacter silviterrae]|uniref:RNA polymerase sigma-70 factor (ECF subfamily) n=1 Tax=Dinghuibacter silviterrae TaxID=1539049 RepID=A0A4V6Q9V1_9BACT|nr:RNA polymerase sigma-70 factor [Dinghuibacter silviterrae]TDW96252.1 RNA polymerase sigma-70 factor (ECF subfamily) [Dinghuibacter silviterrae]